MKMYWENIDDIRENENVLREKFGKSARDLQRESNREVFEVYDVKTLFDSLKKAADAYKSMKEEVENVIARMAGDAFIYYPDHYADNWIGGAYDNGVTLFGTYGPIAIEVASKIDEEKVDDFCQRTGLVLKDIRHYGSLLYNDGNYNYIFGFDNIDSDECDDCDCGHCFDCFD